MVLVAVIVIIPVALVGLFLVYDEVCNTALISKLLTFNDCVRIAIS